MPSSEQPQLHQLVYISRSCLQVDEQFLEVTLDKLAEQARQANFEAGIFGAMLYIDGCFVQVFEGDRVRVEETFDRIQKDARHTQLAVLSTKSISRIRFSDWPIIRVAREQSALSLFEIIAHNTHFEASQFRDEQTYDVLQQHLRTTDRLVDVMLQFARNESSPTEQSLVA